MTRNVLKIPYWVYTSFLLKSDSNYRRPLRRAASLGLHSVTLPINMRLFELLPYSRGRSHEGSIPKAI